MNKREFIDLSKLAQKRARDGAMLVLQLLDDDEERVAMLIYLAIDHINGATQFMRDSKEDTTEDKAFASVLDMLIHSIGPQKVMRAIRGLMAEGRSVGK
jgi:hypothetical protein